MKFSFSSGLSRSQQNIFLMAFMVFLCLAVFWAFIYDPAKKKVDSLKGELGVIQAEIDKIESISGGEKSLDEAYKKLYSRYAALEDELTKEAGSVLSILSSEADRMDIEVLMIKPEKARPSKIPVKIEERSLVEMPISMNLRCDYITFGEYLRLLSENMTSLVRINKIGMSKSIEHEGAVDIWLNITLYMLRQERGPDG